MGPAVYLTTQLPERYMSIMLAEDSPTPLEPLRYPMTSTKTFGHDLGFSCAFRQWRAQSHCRFIHGYALGFKFVFEAVDLDNCGWVVDFGGLQHLKGILANTFDHKLLVAEDDPWLPTFRTMHHPDAPARPCADVVIVPATGCEAFARMVFEVAEQWLKDAGFAPRVSLVSVEVSEHGANSAICHG
jgi:6-pyruvoyltetrahydropterin/6-carboxytetrahydropterin synthase